jgi:hypothetical protein
MYVEVRRAFANIGALSSIGPGTLMVAADLEIAKESIGLAMERVLCQ